MRLLFTRRKKKKKKKKKTWTQQNAVATVQNLEEK